MRKIWYLFLVASGVLLSIPMTIIIIAIQAAKEEAKKMKKYLTDE